MALGDGIGQPPRSSAEINIVPLVDVILVLLVIFIVTAPLITQAVRVDLPQARAVASESPPTVVISIDAQGVVFWDAVALDAGQLEARARELAARPDAQLNIEADRAVPYDAVAQVLATAARAGVQRLAFVTDARVTENSSSITNKERP